MWVLLDDRCERMVKQDAGVNADVHWFDAHGRIATANNRHGRGQFGVDVVFSR